MEFLKVVLFTYSFFLMELTVTRCQYVRLVQRINALEQKLFIDSGEFRESIQDILDRLNDTKCHDDGREFEINVKEVEDIHVKNAHNTDDEEEILDDTVVLHITLKNEKKYIRNVLEDMKAKVTEEIAKQKDFVSDTESVMQIIEARQKEIKDQLKKANDAINNVQQHVNGHDGTLGQVENEMRLFKQEILDEINTLEDNFTEESANLLRTQSKLFVKIGEMERFSDDVAFLKNSHDVMKDVVCKLQGGSLLGTICYFVKNELVTWSEAIEACSSMGSRLAVIKSVTENTFIVNMAKRYPKFQNDLGIWLGASDLTMEGNWIWEPIFKNINELYNNFQGIQPSGGRVENCLHLIKRYDWAWNDLACDRKLGYLCEIEM